MEETGARIKVKQGIVVGCDGFLPNGKPYQYFLGIPYAEPPVGDLRFQAPVPLKSFVTPEIDCTKEGNMCVQKDRVTGEIIGSEDCLYLNVYVPKSSAESPLPVMVYIHGGAYMHGHGTKYTPIYLIQEDVIVVTLNYRLGVLGLFALPEANIPGNMLLKDQHLAMQWVKENIAAFNGDPSNVTLFGESAGSSSAHLHLLSESSKNLFQKIILQSGTANMEWATMNSPSPKIMKLAKEMGCTSEDPWEVVEFMRKYPNVNDFITYASKLVEEHQIRTGLTIPLRPTVEEVSKGAIVTEDPLNTMNKPNSIDIPVMMGYTSAEGLLFLADKDLKVVDKDLGRFVPQKLNLQENDPQFLEITQKIRDFYFKGGAVDKQKLDALADIYGDMNFIIDCYFVAELHSRKQPKSPLYFYRFDYDGELNVSKQKLGLSHLKRACHADELYYLFQTEATKEPWNEKDKRIVEKICKLWANFAKYSNPTPDKNDCFVDCTWEPVHKVGDNCQRFNLNAFVIDEQQRMFENPDGDRMDFWRDIYKTYNGSSS